MVLAKEQKLPPGNRFESTNTLIWRPGSSGREKLQLPLAVVRSLIWTEPSRLADSTRRWSAQRPRIALSSILPAAAVLTAPAKTPPPS